MRGWGVLMGALSCATCVVAATNSWNGGDGDWNSSNKWSLQTSPAIDQDVAITNAGFFAVTLDDGTPTSALTVASLVLSNVSGSSALVLTNRPSNNSSLSFQVLGDVVVGAGSTLKMSDASGTNAGINLTALNLYNTSTLTVEANTTLTVSNILHLGFSGTGTLWQTGGQIDSRNADSYSGIIRLAGEQAGSEYMAMMVCSGGVLRASDFQIGQPSPVSFSGTSVWTIAGGTSIVDRTVCVMGDATHPGLLRMTNGRLQVPYLALGVLVVNRMTTTAEGGAVSISGGEIDVTRNLAVSYGQGLPSQLTISGGKLTITNNTSVLEGRLGIGVGGIGEVNVSSGNLFVNRIFLGPTPYTRSRGTFTMSGGNVDIYGPIYNGTDMTVGEYAGSTGTVVLTGGRFHAGSITVGGAGFGTMLVSSNADMPGATSGFVGLNVGYQSGSVGIVSFTGSGPSFPYRWLGYIKIGDAAGSTGEVFATDGTFVTGSSCFGLIGVSGSGRLSFTNSHVQMNGFSIGAKGTLEFVNSDLNAPCNGMLNNNMILFVNSKGTFTGSFQNLGTLAANDSTLTFSGPLANFGTIIATNGSVQFPGGVTNAGNVVLASDQFLITSVLKSNSDVVINWRAFGGNRYRVQAANGLPASFSDISPEIVGGGNGFALTNFADVGAATNISSRIYRVRQLF